MSVWIVHYDIDYSSGIVLGVYKEMETATAYVESLIVRNIERWSRETNTNGVSWFFGDEEYSVTEWSAE